VSNDDFIFAILAGQMARATDRSALDNPHPSGSPLWHFWRLGYRRDETVSRGTAAGCGPLRHDWSDDEVDLLNRCVEDGVALHLAAQICGHSYAATRTKLCRILAAA
jgi:hypothetical protein